MGKRPTKEQAWIGLLSSALVVVSGFFGWDKYGPAPAAPTTSNTTNIIESSHAHRSTESIQALIDNAVDAYKRDHEQGGKFHE